MQSKQEKKKKKNWKEIAVAINKKSLKARREGKVNRGGFQVWKSRFDFEEAGTGGGIPLNLLIFNR